MAAALAARLVPRADREEPGILALRAGVGLERNGGKAGDLRQPGLEVAEELYPLEWRQLTPRLVTIASWVGYDLDGRSDIGWTDTLHMHLRGHGERLRLTLEEVASIRSAALSHEPAGQALAAALDRMSTRGSEDYGSDHRSISLVPSHRTESPRA